MKKKLHFIYPISRCVTLIALILIQLNAHAQTIYTDIVPDFTSAILYDSYSLDLNNNHVVDYIISSDSDDFFTYLQIKSPNTVNSVVSVTPWFANPIPLNSGVRIDYNPTSTMGESYETYCLFTIGDCFGGNQDCFDNWENVQDKYLGLKFLINGSTHFGWARMDVTSATEWTIKDYAYKSTPNTPIFAGDMVLGLEELDLNKVKVWVANQKISIINLTNRTTFNLYTINGQRLLQGELQQNSDSIDVQNLTTGLYILELRDQNSQLTLKRKILIP